jgi:hypothetical protein
MKKGRLEARPPAWNLPLLARVFADTTAVNTEESLHTRSRIVIMDA